jgi:hypothetical protein
MKAVALSIWWEARALLNKTLGGLIGHFHSRARVDGVKKQIIGSQSQVVLFSFGVMKEEIIHSCENAAQQKKLKGAKTPKAKNNP